MAKGGSMEPELKKKWVEALRSGEFKQGRGQLYSKNQGLYCCLGVLCKVAGVETECYEYNTYYLPNNLANKQGITSELERDLAEMNDSDPSVPFSKIADWIEQNKSL